jgi:hypothetical protein
MNKELETMINEHADIKDSALKHRHQMLIGKKVFEIINENVEFNKICDELGVEPREASLLITRWLVTASK